MLLLQALQVLLCVSFDGLVACGWHSLVTIMMQPRWWCPNRGELPRCVLSSRLGWFYIGQLTHLHSVVANDRMQRARPVRKSMRKFSKGWELLFLSYVLLCLASTPVFYKPDNSDCCRADNSSSSRAVQSLRACLTCYKGVCIYMVPFGQPRSHRSD